MSAPPRPAFECGQDLVRVVESSIARVRVTSVTRYVALRARVGPEDLLDRFVASDLRDAFYWEEAAAGFSLTALGRAAEVAASGRDRFPRAAREVEQLYSRIDGDGAPLLVGGFGFYESEPEAGSEWSGLGAGRLLLPELCFVRRAGAVELTICCAVEPGDSVEEVVARLTALRSRAQARVVFRRSGAAGDEARERFGPEIRVRADRPHSRYTGQVEAALEAIEAGKVEKLVLARSLEVHGDRDFDRRHFFDALRNLYPSCVLAIVREAGETFVAATPERLVGLREGRVETAAVAGSAPRGRNPAEEERYSEALLGCAKEREEHEVVKRAIRSALSDLCGVLHGPVQPRLLKLEGIQHLETPLAGSLEGEGAAAVHLLDLVGRLHPTPAVAGAPRAAAIDWLERFEGLDRGWYAGPIGYVDAAGAGEFRVALRSARLGARDARLFAGAGIVRGSEPQRELAETRLKLRTLLAPLTEI